jgi:hypothetical protein
MEMNSTERREMMVAKMLLPTSMNGMGVAHGQVVERLAECEMEVCEALYHEKRKPERVSTLLFELLTWKAVWGHCG